MARAWAAPPIISATAPHTSARQPDVVLIPLTPQTSQEAATYVALSLVSALSEILSTLMADAAQDAVAKESEAGAELEQQLNVPPLSLVAQVKETEASKDAPVAMAEASIVATCHMIEPL